MPGGWAAISAASSKCEQRCATGLPRSIATSGRKVCLVGWSLGGVYARDLALQAPEMVRYVVTLGSPFANDMRATNATRLYEALSGETVEDYPELRAGDRRRSAGAGDVDLFEARRYRELADLSAASLRHAPRISRSISPAMSASASTRRRYGRWRTAWRSRRANSGHLTGQGRLPLPMRPRNRHVSDRDEKRRQRRPRRISSGGEHG